MRAMTDVSPSPVRALLFLLCGSLVGPAVCADPASTVSSSGTESWAIHGQMTNVTQWHPAFRSPYGGVNSLDAHGPTEETTDATLYAGARPWPGAELWLDPEIDQGFGLSNTVGVAGFPSGEAYKIGSNTPYLRLPRAFLRQTVSLGADREQVDGSANQLAGAKSADAVVLTVGKFAVTDVFDTNSYAHDPRSDFLNWSIVDTGVFDYAADPWGFTYGGAAELIRGGWTVRGGVFQLSPVPNGKITAVDFGQTMLVSEVERRTDWLGRPGKLKVLGFVNRGRMADYSDAVRAAEQTDSIPDVALVRRRSSRAGAAINGEQEISDNLGVFARMGLNDGHKEAYEFTEINQSLSAGLALKGSAWGRATDVLGVAGAVNALSRSARTYFSDGGTGILIGDGRLDYGPEQIVEVIYTFRVNGRVALSADCQYVDHPAYNRDRGPVRIYAVRAHAEF
jgi:high affinity Mn2+ porin